jgi:PAS domain S-box-containing protein
MRTAVEQAGAERGLLILPHGAALQIEAEATTDGDTVTVQLRNQPVTATVLPETVLHYVLHTRESVILDDAAAQPPFAADPYMLQHQARSVLCLLLITQAKLTGLLYLENNLTPGVFARSRIAVLKLLASQAAIALENARLYADLRLSEERWRNLFESVPVGVALTGPDGRYASVNQTFQRMTGYSEAELRKLSPLDITHEDDRAATESRIAARKAGSPYLQHVEKRYRRKDGGVIWIDASAFVAPVVAGTPLFGGAAIDITDRKRAEEDLRRSEASLRPSAGNQPHRELALECDYRRSLLVRRALPHLRHQSLGGAALLYGLPSAGSPRRPARLRAGHRAGRARAAPVPT